MVTQTVAGGWWLVAGKKLADFYNLGPGFCVRCGEREEQDEIDLGKGRWRSGSLSDLHPHGTGGD
jgi:hypothetical protein